jgi:hypothetical protein
MGKVSATMHDRDRKPGWSAGQGTKLTVVGETLSKLHGDDQEGGEGNGVGDVAEGVELCVGDVLRTFDESVGEGLAAGRH